MKRFTLIDGSGLLFRSYYGLPELSDDYGENTHMIYGLAKMTLKFLLDKPDYFAIARDVGGKTIRHEMDEEYKANRVEAPEDLIRQLQLSHELISDLRLPAFGYPGYEADDIIHTFVQKAHQHSWVYTTIISSDKDLKQLIQQDVDMFDPMKNKKTNYLSFQNKYSFTPSLLVDYLALIGDSADNIPGVPWIGPKTANTLIQKYGTIEVMYENLDTITGSAKKKLEAWRESAFRSKELVQLIAVPSMNHIDLQATCCLELDFDIIRHILLDQYNFQSLVKNIDELETKYKQVSMQWLFW